MKKILFMLGMYHPRASANGLCCKNVIDQCVKEGWDVSCVINSYDGNLKPFDVDGAHLHPIKPRLTDRWSEWCELHPTSPLAKPLRAISAVLHQGKLVLMSPLWPWISPLYTYRFYRKAKKLHKEKGFDAVITVYKPIDSLLAGHMLKKKFPEITFVPYYLDAFAGGRGPKRWSEEKLDKRTRRWETKMDRLADAVISMESSRSYHEEHPLPLKDLKRCYLDVPMMLPPISCPPKSASAPMTAVFAGVLSYPMRNPIPLLEVFVRVCKQCDIELLLAGQYNNFSIFEPYLQASDGKIKLLGQLPHDEVLRLERESDLLVNIGSDNPYTITCKIFEYMRFGKPILSTYAIDNEPSVGYLKQYGYAFFIDERRPPEECAAELCDFLRNHASVQIPPDFCEKTFYANTPEAFTALLDQMVKE